MATIYRIECVVTGKSYVGACLCSTRERWNAHCGSARRGSKDPLHAAIRKHGKVSFKRFIIERDLPEDVKVLAKLEAQYIDDRDTLFPNGYNRRKGGGTFRHTYETKRKMSEARKRWMAKPENRKRLSRSLRKYKNSAEGRATMVRAATESWTTRRKNYTQVEISETAFNAAMKRDNPSNGRKGWATRRGNYTQE